MRTAALVMCLLLVGTGFVGAEGLNPYWERIGAGLPNSVVVMENVYERYDGLVNIGTRTPVLWGLTSPELQEEINAAIASSVQGWIEEVTTAAESFAADDDFEFAVHFLPFQLYIEYETKYNRGGLLSLVLTVYEFLGGAHGMTYLIPLNVDLTTGRYLTFADLFPDGDSRRRMAEVVDARIKAEPEIFFIDAFDEAMFHPEQHFYFADGEIVVFFDLYDIAPYASGIQEFSLSVN